MGVALGLGESLAAAAVSPSSAASAVLLSVVCAGPLVEALGEGVGLLAREGKLSSSKVGGA